MTSVKFRFRLRPSAPLLRPRDDRPQVIVAAIDPSLSAENAAFYAAGLARRSNAALLLIHVCRPAVVWPDLRIAVTEFVETPLTLLPGVVATAPTIAPQFGLDVELVVEAGFPAHEVSQVARDRQGDLIVVGTPSSRRHRIAGSVASRLARKCSSPIVMVP